MRTNIEIDDQLIHQAMRSSGTHTKRAAVEAGLRLLVQIHSQAGIRRLSLFGSVARGDAKPESDVDLAAEFDPQAGIGMFALAALERRLSELVGRKVDLLPEPVDKQRLRANIDRDRRRAF